MNFVKRGMIIDIDLNPVRESETGKIRPCIVVSNDVYNQIIPVIQVVPITNWNERKARIQTNVVLEPTIENGLSKISIADCLQTRPIDYKERMVKIRGKVSNNLLLNIDKALRLVFDI